MVSTDDIKRVIGPAVFVLACVFLTFLAGVVVSIYEIFPYSALRDAVKTIGSNQDPQLDYQHFLKKARYSDSGVTVYKPDSVQPGVTLVTGFWRFDSKWRQSIRLVDFEGNVLHEWPVRPDVIGADLPSTDKATPTNYVHGTHLMPDGDIVFNIEYLTMVRMNACGDVKWTVPYRLHHSIDVDDDGNFWAAGIRWRNKLRDEYPHLRPIFAEESMVQVSPGGEILRNISVLEVLYGSGYGGTFASNQKQGDLTHVNDVEILSADIADKFPMFEAGDIMVSLRNFSMIIVVDGKTEKVKWHFRHPLIHQHDPDFEADGHIVIFDNQDDTTRDGSKYGESRLLRVNPKDNTYSIVYPLTTDQPMYTQEGGKHQLLENGNRLITEANPGRVFEITPDGTTVWSWLVEKTASGYVPEVLEGTRYPTGYAKFDSSMCAKP